MESPVSPMWSEIIGRVEKCTREDCQACTKESSIFIHNMWRIYHMDGEQRLVRIDESYHVNIENFDFTEIDENEMTAFEILHS